MKITKNFESNLFRREPGSEYLMCMSVKDWGWSQGLLDARQATQLLSYVSGPGLLLLILESISANIL